MDKITTLEEYALQCEKAVEIQKNWNPSIGDYVITKGEVGERMYWLENRIWKHHIAIFETQGIITKLNGYGAGKIGVDEKLAKIAQGETDGEGFYVLTEDLIYCPRQDQLQGMIGIKTSLSLMKRFTEWFFVHRDIVKPYNFLNFSMEQLWLAFVMKEEYGKIWNGEDWVKDAE